MPHKLHHVLILLRSLLRDSVTSDLVFGDGLHGKRVASSAYDTSIFSNPNHISWVCNMKSKGPSTLPCGTPKITFLYSLNWPSTTTLCSLFDKNSVRMLRKGSPTPNCLSLNRRASWFTRSKAAVKSRPTMHTSQPLSNAFWTKLVMVRRASQVPRPLQKPNCKFGKKFLFSAKLFRCLANKGSKTLDKTGWL